MMLKSGFWILLAGVLATGGAQSQPPVKNAILLTLPKLDWVLEVQGTDLIVEQKELTADGSSARFLAADWASGILISGFLEDRGRPATAEECREFYQAKLKETPVEEEEVAQSKLGDLAIAEYLVKEHAGQEMNQKHVNAYLTKGNVWMDVHLSKLHFKEGERELFNTILRRVKLAPRQPAPKVRASYRVTEQMVLRLDLPPGWSDQMRPGSGNTPPVLQMTPGPGAGQVSLSVLCLKEDMPEPERRMGIHKIIESAGRQALAQAVETALDLREFKGKSGAGCLFTLTDKAPKPGEFKYLTQGGCGVGRLAVLFTILSHEKDSEASKLALAMIAEAQAVTDRPRKTPAP